MLILLSVIIDYGKSLTCKNFRYLFEKVGMTARSLKDNDFLFFVNFIDEQPVRLYVAFPPLIIIPCKRMIMESFGQLFFLGEFFHYFMKFINIFTQIGRA